MLFEIELAPSYFVLPLRVSVLYPTFLGIGFCLLSACGDFGSRSP